MGYNIEINSLLKLPPDIDSHNLKEGDVLKIEKEKVD